MDSRHGDTARSQDTGKRRYQTSNKRTWQWIISEKCFLILVILMALITLAYAISKIAMGIVYMSDCPMEIKIPIYLLVSGCAMFTFAGFYKLRPKAKEDQSFEDRVVHFGTIIALLGLLFFFVWLICGTVWVFNNYDDAIAGCAGSTSCCDTNLMRYAYAITVVDWIFICISIITILVTGCLIYCARVAN